MFNQPQLLVVCNCYCVYKHQWGANCEKESQVLPILMANSVEKQYFDTIDY